MAQKVVGVDVDQSYIDACIVTSAMKGLQNVTETILGALEAGEWDATYGGKFITYSPSEGDYVGIPTAESSWRFNNFTMEQYEAVHAKLMSGEIVVDNNSDNVNPRNRRHHRQLRRLIETKNRGSSDPRFLCRAALAFSGKPVTIKKKQLRRKNNDRFSL